MRLSRRHRAWGVKWIGNPRVKTEGNCSKGRRRPPTPPLRSSRWKTKNWREKKKEIRGRARPRGSPRLTVGLLKKEIQLPERNQRMRSTESPASRSQGGGVVVRGNWVQNFQSEGGVAKRHSGKSGPCPSRGFQGRLKKKGAKSWKTRGGEKRKGALRKEGSRCEPAHRRHQKRLAPSTKPHVVTRNESKDRVKGGQFPPGGRPRYGTPNPQGRLLLLLTTLKTKKEPSSQEKEAKREDET